MTRHYRLYDPEKRAIIHSTAPHFIEDKRLEVNWDIDPRNEAGTTIEDLPIVEIDTDEAPQGRNKAIIYAY